MTDPVTTDRHLSFIENRNKKYGAFSNLTGYQASMRGLQGVVLQRCDVINSLIAAQSTGRLKNDIRNFHKPSLLIIDELGYLPIAKTGADLLFQIIGNRYEQASLIIAINRAFKNCPETFNNDSTLRPSLLDRFSHNTETMVIEGKSYRIKEAIDS